MGYRFNPSVVVVVQVVPLSLRPAVQEEVLFRVQSPWDLEVKEEMVALKADVSLLTLSPITVRTTGASSTGLVIPDESAVVVVLGIGPHDQHYVFKCQIHLWRICCCLVALVVVVADAGLVSLGSSSQIADIDIATVGDTAHGVFLQSIGGGGGTGGSVTSGAAGGDLSATPLAPLAVGGSAGDVGSLLTGNLPW